MKQSFKQFLTEMPQHYPGNVTYMKDSKFVPISYRNIEDYDVLGEDGVYIYLITPSRESGFIFRMEDLKDKPQQVLPVMRLSLRDTNINGYKQAHALRIREGFSKENLTSSWYDFYVQEFGGIVSDNEHLEGGKLLWKHFIKKAHISSDYSVTLFDSNTGEPIADVISTTPDDVIWSNDPSKKHLVLVYEYLPQ